MMENKNEMFGRITDLDISPIEYAKLVSDFNVLIQRELSEKLAENSSKLGNAVTLVTIGSDARFEKASFMSPLEVVAITDQNIDLELYQKELTRIINEVSPTPIAKIIEMKGLDSPLITAYNNSYQPARIGEARTIYGTEDRLYDAKERLGQEIAKMPSTKMSHITGLKRRSSQIMEKGKNTFAGMDAIHFDLKSGAVFFNPEAHQLSFKVGPLRLVQNTLILEEVRNIRQEKNTNLFNTLKSNISKRLQQLSSEKMINLNPDSVSEIMEHYAFFLRLYHRSEKMYAQSKQVTMQLEPKEVQEVAKRLQSLSLLMDKFQIKKQPR